MMLPQSRGGYRIPRSYFYRPPNTDEWYVEVSSFDEQEAREAYQKYQRRYRFQPERFEDLEPVLRTRLREPLLLWLISEICTGDRVTVGVAGADISVIPAYTRQFLRQLGLDAVDRRNTVRFLEETLPKLMVVRNTCCNTVPKNSIPPGSRASFGQLVEGGILEETFDGQIRFRFERFYDHYFGHHLRYLAGRGMELDCRPSASR
jgi:hypothetical protein